MKAAATRLYVPYRTWQDWECGAFYPRKWAEKMILEKLEYITTKNNGKFILDACCGGRQFWFDKNNPLTTFIDSRSGQWVLSDSRRFNVSPDMVMDFTALDFPDKSFKLVVFDPPHLTRAGDKSFMAIKYGRLGKDWRKTLRQGFGECWRVLDDYGVLIFKWSENNIKLSEVAKLFPDKPLFGHTTDNKSHTYWVCFMKSS